MPLDRVLGVHQSFPSTFTGGARGSEALGLGLPMLRGVETCRHEKLQCVNNSRRLKEARVFIVGVKSKLTENGNSLDLAFAEGVQWICSQVAFTTRKLVGEVSLKYKWLDMVPWRIAEAESPEQASICRQQLLDGDPAKMTLLELRCRHELVDDLEVASDII